MGKCQRGLREREKRRVSFFALIWFHWSGCCVYVEAKKKSWNNEKRQERKEIEVLLFFCLYIGSNVGGWGEGKKSQC